MQANIWNAHSNASIKFMSLLSLLVCSNFNGYPYFHISSPMSKFSPFVILFMSMLPLLVCSNFNWYPYFQSSPPMSKFSPFVIFSLSLCNFSPFVINDHKGLILHRLILSMSINGVRIIFLYLVQSRTLAKDI